MFQFAHPKYLYLLSLVPFLLLVFIFVWRQRRKALKAFGDASLVAGLTPDASALRPWIKFILIEVVISLVVIALAGPQFGTKLKEVKREGIELVIALDVSNSMLAEDITPSRLEKAKQAISKLVDRLQNDKIALIVFAGDAYVQLPLTTDYAAAKIFLNTITPDLMPRQGTAIGAAIDLAMKTFTAGEEKNKAIVIITDGENHEGNAIEMATAANDAGIVVHTIGMGLAKGAPIPKYNQYGQKDYRNDNQGNVVISKLNDDMLKKIAIAGGGTYIRANNTKAGLNALFDEMNKLQKVEMNAKVYADYEEQYQFFLGFAILFLLFEIILLSKRNRRLAAMDLFKNTKL